MVQYLHWVKQSENNNCLYIKAELIQWIHAF
jgi:hypothetical protein